MPSEYSIKFWVNGIRYWYQLTATTKLVIHEKLSYYKTVQPIKVFERVLEDGQSVLSFNPAVQKIDQEEQKALTLNCLPNKSFFAARGHVNMKMEHVDGVRQWIRNRFMPMVGPFTNMEKYSKRKIREDVNFKEHLLRFLHQADFNITGFTEDQITVQSMSKGQTLTIDGCTGLVMMNGKNAFDKIEMWDWPRISDQTDVSVSTDKVVMKIKYTPMWI